MLILASQSPRRKELLEMAGFKFVCIPSDYEEDMSRSESVEEMTCRLALGKAQDVAQSHPDHVVLGSDTVVSIDGEVLGKPKDDADAMRMLSLLSGKVHKVTTAVALCTPEGPEVFSLSTDVEFYRLSQKEIEDYVLSGESRDKAGAYAIQGKGALFIKEIRGDYYTVVGLPLAEVARRLEKYRDFLG